MIHKKILLAITCNTGRETYLIPFANSLITNCRNLSQDYELDVHVFGGLSIDLVRTSAALFAVKHNYDALVFFDDDMILPPFALRNLVSHWEEGDKPMVSGTYTSKSMPFHSFIYPVNGDHWLQKYDKRIYEVKTIATGCLLIDTKVFQSLPKPWFLLRRDRNGYLSATEDCYFGNLCYKAGIRMIVDAKIECQHLRLIPFPQFFDHPNYHYDGEWREKKHSDENIPESKGPIIIHAVKGSHMQDGLDVCCHIHQYPLPVNKGEEALYQCLDCGLISSGEQFGGLNVINPYQCSPKDMEKLVLDLDNEE